MSTEIQISDKLYDEGWAGDICRLWNEELGTHFPMTERLWLQNTTGDPDYDPSDVLLALTAEGRLVGLALTKSWAEATIEANPGLEKYRSAGYLSVLLVHPAFQHQGLGRQLLQAAEKGLWEAGASQILLGQSFYHFFPGLPATLGATKPFFEKAGYQFYKTEYDLDGLLAPEIFEPVLQNEHRYRQAQPDDLPALLVFLDEVFPGRWAYTVRLYLAQGMALEDISLLLGENDRVRGFLMNFPYGCRKIGPSVYWLSEEPAWGGIGPLGIDPAVRGKGAGLGLVATGMRYLYNKGARKARIDWTDLIDFYGKLGFKPAFPYWQARKPKPASERGI